MFKFDNLHREFWPFAKAAMKINFQYCIITVCN